ncbi:MAG: OsmC family protein [Woeseiaceae bacterium]|nr:OsmC family protein [Woeseiaceae bacterium]
MQDLPHLYTVTASAAGNDNVILASTGVSNIESAGPPEFGGPGDVWSPEGLLVAAVADCFVLTFRAIARSARLDWLTLECKADGTLDKLDGMTQFTEFKVTAELLVPSGTNEKKAATLLQKAEKHCLITNSMKAASHLDAGVIVEGRDRP